MAHSNTIFSQLLQLLDRNAFDAIERKGFQPKRKYRSLTRWGQLVTMMFAHITNRSCLRDIEEQFRIKVDSLYHLGLKPVKRSTHAVAKYIFQSCEILSDVRRYINARIIQPLLWMLLIPPLKLCIPTS
jgi:Domain of unknown function (DUF4372)